MTAAATDHDALARHAAMMAALARTPAAGDGVETIETHISSVLLSGACAYKVKKPVDLGFVDFTTLERRRHFCAEEVRINRRTAPALYLDVVPIVGTVAQPRLGTAEETGTCDVLDYAVRMVRFAGDALLDRRARAGRLAADEIDTLAQEVAAFHAAAARTTEFGAPHDILRWARDNLAELQALRAGPLAAEVARLAEWTEREFERIAPQLSQRRAHGFVRECHGDLHLGNIVLLDGVPTPFDAIEFNPQLRWIDVASDLAFLFMDLLDHGLVRFAWRLVDRYLQASGDYDALGVLRFYSVYRALVRAKVAHIRADQAGADQAGADQAGAEAESATGARAAADAACAHYLRLATTFVDAARHCPVLAITCGLSGSGKTTVAGLLVEQLGAVRVRSDIERKRMSGLTPTARPDGAAREALYAPQATARTYRRLARIGRTIVTAGYPAVIDAAFLRRDERDDFRALAQSLGARFALIECTARPEVLRARIAARSVEGADASDATLAVLEQQLATHAPPAGAEARDAWRVPTDAGAAALEARCAEIAAALSSPQEC